MKIDKDIGEKDRWGLGIPHDPRSEEIVRALVDIDLDYFGDHFCWKVGGDGDNGETLMYELDCYFEQKDRNHWKYSESLL
jgi:hypothetical protein